MHLRKFPALPHPLVIHAGGMALADERGTRTEITANGQGRVTIPASIRRAAGIEPGTPLAVYVQDGRVVIETRESDVTSQQLGTDVDRPWTS